MIQRRTFFIILVHLFMMLLVILFFLEFRTPALSLPERSYDSVTDTGVPIEGLYDQFVMSVFLRDLFSSRPEYDFSVTQEKYLSEIDSDFPVLLSVDTLYARDVYYYLEFDINKRLNNTDETENDILILDDKLSYLEAFDAYFIDEKNMYNKINSVYLYVSDTYQICFVEYKEFNQLWVDESKDQTLEYKYTFSDDLKHVDGIYKNKIEQVLYTGYNEMINKNVDRLDFEFNQQHVMILRKRTD